MANGAGRPFDATHVAEDWDRAADAYALGQASGRDFYRYEFFGPAHVAQCGDVAGLDVLDVGCGAGYLARELAMRGARVTGVDLSTAMLAHARKSECGRPLGIGYDCIDAAELDVRFASSSFDLAVSCVALQDMPRIDRVFAAIHAVIRPGGRLVASITHPCSDTPYRHWHRGEDGAKRWLCLDRYFDRGPVEYEWNDWQPPFRTRAMHACLEDWFDWILAAGFRLRAFREPQPDARALARRAELEDATRMPYFIIFDLERASGAS